MIRGSIGLVSITILFLLHGCSIEAVETVTCMSKGKGEISYLAKTYQAGDKIKFKLTTENLKDEDILIVWDSKFGEKYFDKTIFSEEVLFSFPDSLSIYSGFATIKVIHCDKILCQKSTYVESLHPVGTIESYIGPKTLAIDQNMQSMMCLIPTDKFGNALEDTQKVTFNTKYRKQSTQTETKNIDNLLTYIKIENNKQVGKVLLGAKCVDSYIDEQEIAIVQGPMQEVKINIVEMHPYGDDRQLVHLNTDVIHDLKGNIIADGSSVIFVVHENDKIKAQYQAYTVSGIASVFIENPKNAAKWTVSVSGAAKGNEVHLNFQDNIESIPLRIEKNYLVIGPVIGSLDQYIPDGTQVAIVFNNRFFREEIIEHGFARVEVPERALSAEELISEVTINNIKVKLIY